MNTVLSMSAGNFDRSGYGKRRISVTGRETEGCLALDNEAILGFVDCFVQVTFGLFSRLFGGFEITQGICSNFGLMP